MERELFLCYDKQNVEKQVILDVLKKSIRGLLQSNELIDLVETEDSPHTKTLCSSIEALFLHGQLKNQSNTIFARFGRSRQPYNYDFWNFIRDFIPKSLINKLENHSFKLTAVGFSRVWLRYALNECTILSYLESIRSNNARLQHFYSKEAMIRNQEMMETFCGLLTSIERIPFNLTITDSILNTWINSDALKIAGIDVVVSVINENLLDCSISSTNDYPSLAVTLTNDEEVLTRSINLPVRYSSSVPHNKFLNETDSSIGQSVNSCQTVDILYNDINLTESSSKINNEESKSEVDILPDLEPNIFQEIEEVKAEIFSNDESGVILNETIIEDVDSQLSNSPEENNIVNNDDSNDLNTVDHDLNINDLKITDGNLDHDFTETCAEAEQPCTENTSYDQTWAQHNLETIESVENINVSVNEEKLTTNDTEESQNELITSTSDSLNQSKVYSSLIASKYFKPTTDFVFNIFIRRFNLPIFTVKESDESWEWIGDEILAQKLEMKRLMDIFPGVNMCSTNNGLNSVFGGLCSKCAKPLESGKAMIDHYDGKLFCTVCESFAKSVIPRNVIYNWDFDQKFVSETTKRFLSEIMSHPNINLADHPNLFDVIPELGRVRKLRQKLNLLWLQVTSCDIETSTKVRETMFPREYMLATMKENDLYSLEDLIILQSGVLEKTLLFVINKIAIPHVKKCLMCRMKAMACDKCRDEKKVIYIHEIDEYCECSTPLCKSVIHKSCKNPTIMSFYCRRCIQYLENQQPITLANYDTANYID